jgi:ankyrin repeat protein
MLIHDAAIKNDLSQIQKLAREKGLDFVKSADLRKNTILHLSCEGGFDEIVDYSLDIGLDINKPNDAGDSPLILAAKRGDFEIVKKLVVAGAKINHSNKHGNTALHYSCFWRMTEISLFLVKTANAYIKVANNYNQLPADRTSNVLKITLEGDFLFKFQKSLKLKEARLSELRR